ncbi:MAG TPA: dUTP diphosphatase [Baekduia sp.]|uniref:dUTP diphosphatase n=1 Tax=Baekduia sp. TaxID=2600305 RepID=UPI002C0F5D96|nr:dUTP diphosphatase [Baekduia sp.]HMJ37537.1 dUTP diphosphatase [Baekduia sp.]
MDPVAVALDQLEIKLVREGARAPERSRPGDAGYDLRCLAAVALAPGGRVKVDTGVAIALPAGFCGLVVPRSGLAARHGVVPALGLIDPNFRGELAVTLLNTGAEPFRAEAGDRIAQLLLLPFWAPALAVVDELPPSPDDRGVDGWGSSGR